MRVESYLVIHDIPELNLYKGEYIICKANGKRVNSANTKQIPSYVNLNDVSHFKSNSYDVDFQVGDMVKFYRNLKDSYKKSNPLYGEIQTMDELSACIRIGEHRTYADIKFRWMKKVYFYYFISSSGKVCKELDKEDEASAFRKKMGNYFPDSETAMQKLNELKLR